ncbi:LacI family transcriptional regulator [Streptosporangium becharense]|uniref:LacI family transcriptional regulator n=1 Tax=Streptosporangium becharense TaxID=1816182 RepID=A0A7W9ILQ6_9ACTN|nr:LacI family DNA-binding transcriptional regulator [Streptosporangium becharense]MBB2910310.1 LacI family transcriptional regulator [Streptosporangium becharense]MBB5823053.1 LacI family transcriptional regulator [Streptosporangium becharense]
MAVTLADVARRAGTSTAVVSYVMNDGPRPVAAATRERVLAAAAELGYRPNRIARALRARVSGVVGLVLADASNPYFAALARHIEQALESHGKLTLLGNAGFDPERQRQLAERFLDAQVDGLAVVSSDGGLDVATRAAAAGVPAVYVHHRPDRARTPLVAADNEASVHAAVEHLRWHGHRRIAFLTGPDDVGPVGERRRAWQEAVAPHEREPRLLRCDFSRAAAAALVQRLAAEDMLPRAVIVATDEQAIGVLSGASAAGLAVPDRLAVISCDGAPESAYTAPSLTVVAQPLEAMARYAVDLLFDRAAPPPALHAPLIPRRSCGCVVPAAGPPG